MLSFGDYARQLGAAAAKIEGGALVEPTEVVMVEVQAAAKAAVGTYAYGWPQLSGYTQEDRVRLGFSPNDPLLRSGALQASIAHKTEAMPGGAEGLIYSGEKTALWAEMGTSRGEPPRSFLYESLLRVTPTIARVFGAFLERILAP
jgi:hypothetical protein